MGLMMLASGLVRARGAALDPGRQEPAASAGLPRPDQALGDDQATTVASLSPLDPMSADPRVRAAPLSAPEPDAARAEPEAEIVVPTGAADPSPEPGNWLAACVLKNGSMLVFDRGSLRSFGPATLVRWAAPADPRTEGQIYTALVNCRGKTIEAAWPGKQSDTRAGTCGRRLVDAVCELTPGLGAKTANPSRALSPATGGAKRGGR